MRKKIILPVLILTVLSILFIFVPRAAWAQQQYGGNPDDIYDNPPGGGDYWQNVGEDSWPSITNTVDNDLQNGESIQQAEQDLSSQTGSGASIIQNPDGSLTVTCGNGSDEVIQNPCQASIQNPYGNCGPQPTPSTPYCGDNVCNNGEDCNSCPQDCGDCSPGSIITPTPTPIATPTATLTPTPIAACGVTCQTPADCQSAQDGCTDCINNVCSPQPTPTPVPACGVACQTPADCQNAKDACTDCINNICSPQPTPTPVPACGVACQTPADCQNAKDACTDCINNVCSPQPTPTPTPIPFNPASCTCDGINYTNLFSGQNATITADAKVVGADVDNAQVVSQSFYLAQGAETIATIIAKSGAVPANVISSSSNQVEYQSQWNLTLPQLQDGSTYRLWSEIDCQPKTSAINYPSFLNKVVLGAQTQAQQPQPSLFDRIFNFFAGLFGISPTTSTATVTPTPAQNVSNSSQTGNKQLQLGTVTPVQVYQKTCTFIKFKVGE